MKNWRAVVGIGMILLAAFCGTGCTHFLARQMVRAPNRRLGNGPTVAMAAGESGNVKHFSVQVGPPNAWLALWVIEPKVQPAKGTIIVLHGFLANHHFVQGAADEFVKAGYRAVMVDLRGHGESTGDQMTYGVVESRDLAQVTDYLQAHQMAEATVGVYGTSLGAAIAIDYAAIDPRVTSVVAVAPYAVLKDEVPRFGRVMLPIPGWFMSDADFAEVLRDGAAMANFDPAAANPLDAIKRVHARVLLIHGGIDAVIPSDNSRQLHAASPASELVILPAHGHLAACNDITGEVPKLARKFFERKETTATAKK